MEIIQKDIQLKDFDKGGYDEVEFVPKEKSIVSPAATPITVQSVEEREIDLEIATGSQLLEYFVKRFKESHGYEYIVDLDKDKNTFNLFRDRYGRNAGLMVKILFDKYNGKLSVADGVVTTTAFSRGSKWIQDKLYCDLQEQEKYSVNNSIEGLMSSSDFRKMFNMAK
jgi:hypothetical protein